MKRVLVGKSEGKRKFARLSVEGRIIFKMLIKQKDKRRNFGLYQIWEIS
jgi:hypothetical protein